MNERLTQLAEQAKLYSRSFTYQQEVFEKKFAELIVQECIDVHEDHYGVDIIGDVLKKHFGVDN